MYLLSCYVLCAGVWTLAADAGVAPRFSLFLHGVSVGDKLIHFMVVGGFAVVLARAFAKLGWRVDHCRYAAMATAALLATVEELTNLLTPHRTFSGLDLVADYSGILLLTALAWGVGRGLRGAARRLVDPVAEPMAPPLGMFSKPA